MSPESRQRFDRPSLRKRATPGSKESAPRATTLFSRKIVNSEPQELHTAHTFHDALTPRTADSPESNSTGSTTQVIIPWSTPELLAELASAWDLHPVLVDDLFHANQRAKVERYGEVLFAVLKSAVYIDAKEEVEFNEFHLLMKDDVLVIICQGDRFIDGTPIATDTSGIQEYFTNEKRSWTKDRELLALGPEALIYRLLDTAVDGYFPVLDGLQDDKDGIERQVFSGDTAAAERIYLLSQEVIDVLHNSTHLNRLTQALGNGAAKYAIPDDLRAYLDDVSDHLTRVLAEAGELRESLSQILNVNSTLVAQRQNEDMKKISGWAAILFAPTLVGAIYGMNFDDMPELHWAFGYPMALGLMLGLGVVLYVVFRVKKWM
ncbi:magnesium and cobalt transport protein CorA [Brevibacterium sp. SIMBA_078]|uniref:magnesium and cobalt transport protein CorA n=1 Tax=Brevibacterium sp. SIMBA_078 TaxID=3085816 RepID=UPI003979894B